MKTVATGQVLGKAARAVKAVTGSRYLPVLDNARVIALPGSIQISGTDLETWIHYSVDCDTGRDTNGAPVFVDAGRLSGAVKSLKGNTEVGITAGALSIGALLLPGNPDAVEDYPVQAKYGINPAIWTARILELSGAEFKAMMKRNKATSKKSGDTTRLSLTGINIEYALNGNGARLTTTDGYSLNTEEYGATLQKDATRRALVCMAPLLKAAAAAGARDTVTFIMLEEEGGAPLLRLKIESAAATIDYYIRSIAEEFPDYSRVVPAASNALASFTVDPAEFARVVSAARTVAPSDSEAVTVTVLPAEFTHNGAGPDLLKISADSAAGSFSESISITRAGSFSARGDLAPVSFNADYLVKISAFSDNPITIHLAAPLQAARIDYGAGRVAVLMPVNLKGR